MGCGRQARVAEKPVYRGLCSHGSVTQIAGSQRRVEALDKANHSESDTMILQCKETLENYSFVQVPLQFVEGEQTNTFANKNNKTLRQTLEHVRYIKLETEAQNRFSSEMDLPLGVFLLALKTKNDQFYKRFLNAYGDSRYSSFRVTDRSTLNLKGVYAYTFEDKIVYIGRCRDTMGSRINQGYGKIHPKNCYIDGQATNCHLNALITSRRSSIQLWLCAMELDERIIDSELRLIRSYVPTWNLNQVR